MPSGGVAGGPRALRRYVAVLVPPVVVALFAAVAAALWPFVFPTGDEPFGDGPVVALGGNVPRVERAVAIVDEPGAPRPLILSAGSIEAGRQLGVDCRPPAVLCVDPVPHNTYGEARTIAALQGEHGWANVTAVTDPFHLTRSRLLFERCVDVPVRVVASGPETRSRPHRLLMAVRELASAAASFVVQRAC
jgi:uncharacterized SAM-binding protein YcdF (DUF218 family)